MSSWSRLAALASLVLLLGCPPDDGSVPQAFPVLDATPAPAEGSAPPAPGDDREVFRVCTILPRSGPEVDTGAEIRRGIDIAISEIPNDARRRFDWTHKDTKSTEGGALTAFQACFNEGHHAVIGPVAPAGTTALIPVAAAHDILLVVPQVAAAVPVGWSGSLVAISPPSLEMGRLAAENARAARGLRKGAVLHVGSVFGTSLRDAFRDTFESVEEGGVFVGARELPPDDPDAWAAAAKELRAAGAEALFVVGPPDASKAVARYVGTEDGVQAWFVDWSMQPPVLEAAAPGGLNRVHWLNRNQPTGGFEGKYVQLHQAKPEFSAGSGYDAVKLLQLASEASDSTWHEDLLKQIEGMKAIPSAFGTGAMVEQGGVDFEDVGGYSVVEPKKMPDADVWIFGGHE